MRWEVSLTVHVHSTPTHGSLWPYTLLCCIFWPFVTIILVNPHKPHCTPRLSTSASTERLMVWGLLGSFGAKIGSDPVLFHLLNKCLVKTLFVQDSFLARANFSESWKKKLVPSPVFSFTRNTSFLALLTSSPSAKLIVISVCQLVNDVSDF